MYELTTIQVLESHTAPDGRSGSYTVDRDTAMRCGYLDADDTSTETVTIVWRHHGRQGIAGE